MAVLRKEPYDPAANQYPRMVYLGEVKAGKGKLVQTKEDHDALLAAVKPEAEPVKAAPEKAITAEAVDDKDALAATATSLGIEIDKRWGVERLKTEIAAKRKVA